MNDQAVPVTLPPFMAIWRKHRFRVDIVACEAGVSMNTIFAMLRWFPVDAQNAAKVLAALSRLYQEDYSLKTVWVNLKEGEETHATV
jgi:hypothetical protein